MSYGQLFERSRLISLAEAGLRAVVTVRERLHHLRMERETFLALSRIDDEQLADIGLSRGMIPGVSHTLDRTPW